MAFMFGDFEFPHGHEYDSDLRQILYILRKLGEEIESIKVRVANLEDRMDVVEARLDAIESKIRLIEEQITELFSRMEMAEEEIELLKIEINEIKNAITNIETRLAIVENAVMDHEEAIEELNRCCAEVNSKLTDITKKVNLIIALIQSGVIGGGTAHGEITLPEHSLEEIQILELHQSITIDAANTWCIKRDNLAIVHIRFTTTGAISTPTTLFRLSDGPLHKFTETMDIYNNSGISIFGNNMITIETTGAVSPKINIDSSRSGILSIIYFIGPSGGETIEFDAEVENTGPITAGEYDLLDLSAEDYDNKNIMALVYDLAAKKALS